MVTKPRNFRIGTPQHIYNRGVEKRDIFTCERDYQRFSQTAIYYKYKQEISFVQFNELSEEAKRFYLLQNLKNPENQRVKISGYVQMINHFHFSLKQNLPRGIETFMSDLCNSYTHYFNNKYDRVGGLFQGRYKSKEIPDDQSFLQLSRYIHMNPPKSVRINKNGKLKPEDYPYSSYRFWLDPSLLNHGEFLVDLDEIEWGLNLLSSPDKYKEFVEAKLETDPKIGIESLILE